MVNPIQEHSYYQEQERYFSYQDLKNKKSNFAKKIANNHLSETSQLNLAVVLEGEVIGDLSAWYTGIKDTVEIGYSFSKKHGGIGYASEAVNALVKGLFSEFNLHRLQKPIWMLVI